MVISLSTSTDTVKTIVLLNDVFVLFYCIAYIGQMYKTCINQVKFVTKCDTITAKACCRFVLCQSTFESLYRMEVPVGNFLLKKRQETTHIPSTDSWFPKFVPS